MLEECKACGGYEPYLHDRDYCPECYEDRRLFNEKLRVMSISLQKT